MKKNFDFERIGPGTVRATWAVLKLFVWTEVLTDSTHSVIFALAHNVTEAREVIARDKRYWMDVGEIFDKEPQIVTSPKGFAFLVKSQRE